MVSRLRQSAKKASGSEGYRRVLRWAALPVTDRRWAAPLSAVALGFGLFVGVAIGPGAAGTLATGAGQIIEIPGFSGGADDGESDAEAPSSSANAGGGGGGGGESASLAGESSLPSFAPIASAESETTESTTPSSSPAAPPPSEEPEPEPKETLTGIVLHVNPAAASYTIAEPAGTLDVVHAAKAPQPGTKVSVPTRLLANGTFAEAGTRTRSGERDRATFSGIVTYVDPTPAAPAYVVSKRGVSVLVHVHPDPSGAVPPLPALGAFADVAVDIERLQPASASSAPTEPTAEPVAPVPPAEPPVPPVSSEPAPAVPVPAPEPSPVPATPTCAPDPSRSSKPAIEPAAILWQRQLKAQGAPTTYSDFAGIIEAVCPDTGQLLISADDIRESQHDLIFAVPATIDTTELKVGESVLATATIGADASLSLVGLASDERSKGADDPKAQGDLVPAKKPEAGRAR